MNIARSTFYRPTLRQSRQIEKDIEMKKVIEQLLDKFPGYGYRRIKEHLARKGHTVNSKRIRRVMKMFKIYSSRQKLVGPKGKRSVHQLYHPNLIRGMQLTGPNQLWATDITYIRLLSGYAYLSVVIDVYTRKIIGWSLSRSLSHVFCIESMQVAMKSQGHPKGVIHHSDRGTQYTCDAYVGFLKDHGFKISMSGIGIPQDNAFIEAFFKTLKHEEVYARNYRTMSDVIEKLPKFLDEVYNFERLHSSLGYKTPDEYHQEIMRLKPAERPVHQLWGWAG